MGYGEYSTALIKERVTLHLDAIAAARKRIRQSYQHSEAQNNFWWYKVTFGLFGRPTHKSIKKNLESDFHYGWDKLKYYEMRKLCVVIFDLITKFPHDTIQLEHSVARTILDDYNW